MMAKCYFAILGVSPNASPDEIRSAYRRLAKAYHPDHFPGGSGPFMEIQEAYTVLGDSRKRQDYQNTMDTPVTAGQPHVRTYTASPFRKHYAHGAPEPLVPTRHTGCGDPLVDITPGSATRFHTDGGPSLEDLLKWLLGHPFGPRRR